MNQLSIHTIGLAVLAASWPAAAAGQSMPSADSVIDHFIAVTGGKAAWEARHSQVEHATIEFAKLGVKGSLTIYEAAPDKYLALTELPAIGKMSTGSDGTVAWENSALQGPRIKEGAERAEALRDGAFNAPLFWRSLYIKGENAGSETVEGHDCYKIVLTPQVGQPMTEFFDKKSGFMIKTTATVNSQFGDVNAEVVYDDYRKDGDLISPHRLINRAAQQEFVVEIQSVDVNPEFPKDRFDLPPDVKALLNKPAAVENRAAPARAATQAETLPSDRGKLAIYLAGNPVATEEYKVTSSVGGVDIEGSGSATFGTMKIDIEKFQVFYGLAYRPSQAVAKAKMGGIAMNVSTTFADGQAKNEIENGQGPQSKSIPVHADTIVVNSNLPLFAWTILAMRARLDTHDPQTFPVYVLGQAEVNATVLFKGRERVDFGAKSAELNHLTASGSTPQGQPIGIDFWVDDHRKLIKIAVPSQGVEAYQDGFEPVTPAAAQATASPQ
jgi:hypothetical protein